MAKVNSISPDGRVNQQLAPENQTQRIDVIHYINLTTVDKDLDNVYLESVFTYAEFIDSQRDDYTRLIEKYNLEYKNNGKITEYSYRTRGILTKVNFCIPFRHFTSGIPHDVVGVLNPTGDATSTAQGEAL